MVNNFLLLFGESSMVIHMSLTGNQNSGITGFRWILPLNNKMNVEYWKFFCVIMSIHLYIYINIFYKKLRNLNKFRHFPYLFQIRNVVIWFEFRWEYYCYGINNSEKIPCFHYNLTFYKIFINLLLLSTQNETKLKT